MTAWVVRRIFTEYPAGFGVFAMAQHLTNSGIPTLQPMICNATGTGAGSPGRGARAQAIPQNPRYTGYQVWNQQRKEELLIDVDNVALGHRTQQTWNKKGV
ncbi:recombinase family protein [Streptomyces umbrinus]|uniref:recombinase family protein n=1 Tax=Streptomyces umbrinus TaxID=67370 RepID=UPI003C2C8DC4